MVIKGNDGKRKRSPSVGACNKGPKALKGNDGKRCNCSNGQAPTRSGAPSGCPGNVAIVSSIIPAKSPNDPNEYKVIKMSNGLTAILISRKAPNTSGGPSHCNGVHADKLGGIMGMKMNSKFHPECVFIPEGCGDFQTVGSHFPSMFCTDEESPSVNGFQQDGRKSTSVAIIVNCGGLNDPQDAQGLAHLTEHMVHYGSDKYRGEHQVKEVVLNFGTYNAFTTQMTTGYYNQVPNLILERNMELFSEMLKNPRFDEGMVHREVNAVDDEFHMRHLLMRKYLIETQVSIRNPSHPLARFICGSLETLGNGEIRGTKKLRATMVENHKRNYVASAMTLAINSAKPMDELEDLALKYFSNVLRGERQIRHKTDNADAAKEKIKFPDQEQMVYIQGLTSKSELSLLWLLPSSIWLGKEKEKTMTIIDHLLASSLPGSLNATLRNEKLVWNTTVYHFLLPYTTGLEINFSLTEEGEKNTNLIQEATLGYIQLLQKTDEKRFSRVFNELRLSNLKNFHYGSPKSSLENTIDLAMQLQYVKDPFKVITNDSWNEAKFNYKSIADTLKLLNPSTNLLVVQTLKKQDSLEDKVLEIKRSPGAKCSSINIRTALYTKAKYCVIPRAPIRQSSKFKFEFPCENVFLANELKRLAKQEMRSCAGDQDIPSFLQPPCNFGDIIPQRINYRSRSDPKDGIPKVSGIHYGHAKCGLNPYMAWIKVDFFHPATLATSPRGLALCWLWVMVMEQRLAVYNSEFELEGCSYYVQYSSNFINGNLSLTTRGFPTHLSKIIDNILKTMLNNEPVSTHYFDLGKQALKVKWENYLVRTGVLTQYALLKSLFSLVDMNLDFLGLVDSLTLNDLSCTISSFRKSTFSFVRMWGNVPVTFFNVVAEMLDRLDFAPTLGFDPNMALLRNLMVPKPNLYSPGEQCIRMINELSLQFTCSVTNVYIFGRYQGSGDADSEYFDAAMNFINQFAFLYLRTRNQLGYVVYAAKVSIGTNMSFLVHLTGTIHKHTPCKLNFYIDEFVSHFGNFLETVSDEIFDKLKTVKKIPDHITKGDVACWFNARFGPSFRNPAEALDRCETKGIRKLSIQMLPNPKHPNPVVECPPPQCQCKRCSKIKEWRYGQNQGSTLRYAVGECGDEYFLAF